jgi:hypothetical protein
MVYKEIDLFRTGFFEFKYDIQDCFLLCQESGFRKDDAITIPPTTYQPGFVVDSNFLYFYAFHNSRLFVQQIDINTSQVTQQIFSSSSYFSSIDVKSKFSLTIRGRSMMILKYDEQSLAFAEVDIYKETVVSRRLLTYLDLQNLEYYYIRKNDGKQETGIEAVSPAWFAGFRTKKPVITLRKTDSGERIITIGLAKMKEVNNFARNFTSFIKGFTIGFRYGAVGVMIMATQPEFDVGVNAQELAVEVFDFKLHDNYFYPAPGELKKREIDNNNQNSDNNSVFFQSLKWNNGNVLVLDLH